MKGLRQTAIGILENSLLKTGRVLNVRYWEPANFVEIDLHLPGVDMTGWDHAQHIKCRVGPLVYRDYSPAGWDEETSTCTLYVDAKHNGPGSAWARSVQAGERFGYAGIGHTPYPPAPLSTLVFLGDESSVGHFLSLYQLLSRTSSVSGAIAFSEMAHQDNFADFLRLPLQPLCGRQGTLSVLQDWIAGEPAPADDAIFYLAGNAHMVQSLRKTLKAKGIEGDRIKAQGFWK